MNEELDSQLSAMFDDELLPRSASCWRGACRAMSSSRPAGAGTRSSAPPSAPSVACA